jgi:hypothetical protein
MAGKMLSTEPAVDPTASVRGCRLGAYTGRLAELAWWDWDHETLRRALPDFRKLDVEGFLEKYEAAAGSSRRHIRHQGAAS